VSFGKYLATQCRDWVNRVAIYAVAMRHFGDFQVSRSQYRLDFGLFTYEDIDSGGFSFGIHNGRRIRASGRCYQ
jgi:hypothetical protein